MQYVQIASMIISTIGAISGGNQKSQQYEAQKQANEYNAIINRQKSDNALAVSNQREEQHRRQTAMFLGKQRASAAQAGLGLGGSAGDIERQSEVMAELDSLNIRYEGQVSSQGFLAGAAQDDYAAAIAGNSATSARKSGYLLAASRALSGYADYGRMKSPMYSGRPTLDGGFDLADQ